MPPVAAGQMTYECHHCGIWMREYPLAGEDIWMSGYSDIHCKPYSYTCVTQHKMDGLGRQKF